MANKKYNPRFYPLPSDKIFTVWNDRVKKAMQTPSQRKNIDKWIRKMGGKN